jgi:hypothetical protein
MSMPLEEIKIGRCYLTDGGQVRRVLEFLPEGRIRYERRPAHRPDAPWQEAEQADATFAALAEEEVPCELGPPLELLGIGCS